MPRPHRPSTPPARPAARVVTSSPASASSRAVIMPSPPLLPRPHSTVTRRACGNCSRANAATAAAAARIKSIDATPNRSVVARSQACISAAERTCIASIVADEAIPQGRRISSLWWRHRAGLLVLTDAEGGIPSLDPRALRAACAHASTSGFSTMRGLESAAESAPISSASRTASPGRSKHRACAETQPGPGFQCPRQSS